MSYDINENTHGIRTVLIQKEFNDGHNYSL